MTISVGPQAVYFGSAGEPLFGWLHLPSGDFVSDVGLVVCNPFGFEEVCAHRSLRELAIATAVAGIATLRFDYAGCGNSCGDDFGPQRFQTWISSVHEAVKFLRGITGASRICLLGLRLGASIAAIAASEREDVEELIAIAPVVDGRTYLRELKALDAAKSRLRSEVENSNDLLESAGFLMTRETRESVNQLDLCSQSKAPAVRVLIVERDDLSRSESWAGMLDRLGTSVTVVHWPGYIDMMDDPRRAKVPAAIIAGVVNRLVQKLGGQRDQFTTNKTLVGAIASSFGPAILSDGMVQEEIVQIDTGTSVLFGIATSKRDARDSEARPACGGVLMLNAGSVHHIGPARMWVQLARAWALRGLVVLRLDISGIGDSPPRGRGQENIVYSKHAINDVVLALDYMRSRLGAGPCHLLGLCSGAYHAFKTVAAGHAVESAVLINPLTFYWRDGAVIDKELMENDVLEVASRYRKIMFSREPWLKLLRGQLDVRLISQIVVRRFTDLLRDQIRDWARLSGLRLKDDLADDLSVIASRGIGLRFVFAATSPGHALLRRQGGRIVKRLAERGAVSIDTIADADHTFTQFASRARLFSVLDRHIFPISKSSS